MIRRAYIDRSGENRFWLLRDWTSGRLPRTVVWVMLNPSTADGTIDDPTVRKCIGFAQRLGYNRMYVVNLFSLRATDPRELHNRVGRLLANIAAVRSRLEGADAVVFAWGASIVHAPFDPPSKAVRWLAAATEELDVEPWCLGVSKEGHPRHPLMLSYDAKLKMWRGYDTPEWAFLRAV
jgi:hypothetical protein